MHSEKLDLRQNHEKILNNRLTWDGSHLGSYTCVFTHQWMLEGVCYYGITLPQGWSKNFNTKDEIPAGIIYCTANCTKDVFPCIVEDIKDIFGVARRGIHRIIIDRREYIIYYLPISIKGEIIWETPLNRLDAKHPLRENSGFRKDVQKIIAFCDILALCNIGEPSIRIRPGDCRFIPISVNESTTYTRKSTSYDYGVLNKTLFSKWFGEETPISDIVKEMVHYQKNGSDEFLSHLKDEVLRCKQNPYHITVPNISDINISHDNLAIISSEIRNKVNEVIKRYDNNYIWYSNFIIDRMSRHLLVDIK
jgi:hypothetical protein